MTMVTQGLQNKPIPILSGTSPSATSGNYFIAHSFVNTGNLLVSGSTILSTKALSLIRRIRRS